MFKDVQYAKHVSDETRLDGGTLDRAILDDRRRKRKQKADKKKLERREKLIDQESKLRERQVNQDKEIRVKA